MIPETAPLRLVVGFSAGDFRGNHLVRLDGGEAAAGWGKWARRCQERYNTEPSTESRQ